MKRYGTENAESLSLKDARLLVDTMVASSVPSCTFLALSVSPPSCAIGKIWTVTAPFVSVSTIFLNASAPTLYGLPGGVPRLSLRVTFCCASAGVASTKAAATIAARRSEDVRNMIVIVSPSGALHYEIVSGSPLEVAALTSVYVYPYVRAATSAEM